MQLHANAQLLFKSRQIPFTDSKGKFAIAAMHNFATLDSLADS
jgi:hypothetical protein